MQSIETGKQLSRLRFRRSFLISRCTSDNPKATLQCMVRLNLYRCIVKGGRGGGSSNNYSNLDNGEKGNLLRFFLKFNMQNNNQEDIPEMKLMTHLSGQDNECSN